MQTLGKTIIRLIILLKKVKEMIFLQIQTVGAVSTEPPSTLQQTGRDE
jgi:hypothetical protein